VLLGMVVVCGTDPWRVFYSLSPEKRSVGALVCLGVAWGYRSLDAGKRCGKMSRAWWRALVLTCWGGLWGWVALAFFARQFNPEAQQVIGIQLAVGLAVGVVVQDIWEERPISEPV